MLFEISNYPRNKSQFFFLLLINYPFEKLKYSVDKTLNISSRDKIKHDSQSFKNSSVLCQRNSRFGGFRDEINLS